MNVVILAGTLSRAATRRALPSGDTVVEYELTTRLPDGSAATVNVVWPAAPDTAEHEAGAELVASGVIRRRFFRTGSGTARRTEVVADAIVPAGDRRKVRRGLEHATARAVIGS